MQPKSTLPAPDRSPSPGTPFRAIVVAGVTLAVSLVLSGFGQADSVESATGGFAGTAAADSRTTDSAPRGAEISAAPASAGASPLDQAFVAALEAATRLSANIAGCEAANKYRREMARQWEGAGVELPPVRHPDPQLVAAYELAVGRYKALGGTWPPTEAEVTAAGYKW